MHVSHVAHDRSPDWYDQKKIEQNRRRFLLFSSEAGKESAEPVPTEGTLIYRMLTDTQISGEELDRWAADIHAGRRVKAFTTHKTVSA